MFVHLLDGQGQLVASHDGQPLENRFPTTAWLPGVPVVDPHSLQLPAGLPPGNYQLQAGLYRLADGQRLPVSDSSGTEQVERAISLGAVTIP